MGEASLITLSLPHGKPTITLSGIDEEKSGNQEPTTVM